MWVEICHQVVWSSCDIIGRSRIDLMAHQNFERDFRAASSVGWERDVWVCFVVIGRERTQIQFGWKNVSPPAWNYVIRWWGNRTQHCRRWFGWKSWRQSDKLLPRHRFILHQKRHLDLSRTLSEAKQVLSRLWLPRTVNRIPPCRLATETSESKYNSLGLRDRRRLINDVMQELERTSRRGVLGMAKADLLVAKQEERTLMSPVFQGYLEDRGGIQWRADETCVRRFCVPLVDLRVNLINFR